MAIITPPKTLRDTPGEDGAEALIELINGYQDNQTANITQLVGEKF